MVFSATLVFTGYEYVMAGVDSIDFGSMFCIRHGFRDYKNCFGEYRFFPRNDYTDASISYWIGGHRHGSSMVHAAACIVVGGGVGECRWFDCTGSACGYEYGGAHPYNRYDNGIITWSGGGTNIGIYRESAVEDAEVEVAVWGSANYPDAATPTPEPTEAQPFNLSGSCQVINGSTNRANLSWSASANATSYTVQEHVWSTGSWYDVATGLTGTSFSTDVPNTADYYYRVLAYPGNPTVSNPGNLGVCGRPPTPDCGNGTIDTGEDCDGGNLGGASCASFGYTSGTLSCNSNCTFNTSACVNPPSGCQGHCFQFLGQTINGVDNPGAMTLLTGTTYPATVRIRNNGTASWYGCDLVNGTGVKLGSQNPQDVNPLIPARLCPTNFNVPPGSSIDYNFNFTTPVTPGPGYNFQFSVVEEFVMWFWQNWQYVGPANDVGNDRFTPNVPVTLIAPIPWTCSISASPNSGSAPLNGVDVVVSATGDSASWNSVDCNNDGIYEVVNFTSTAVPPNYTITDACNYPSGGAYTIRLQRQELGGTSQVVYCTAPVNVAAPPTASITGPATVALGSSGTYTLSGAGTNLNRLEAYFSPTSTPNAWVALPPTAACGGASTCNGTVTFNPSALGLPTGTYYLVLNNYDNYGNQCTGNPWVSFPMVGWTDCGVSDAILVTVIPPPTCTSSGPDGDTVFGSTRDVFAYGVNNATSVMFYTWSSYDPPADACPYGAQDDLWGGSDCTGLGGYPGTNLGGGTWRATINLANHRPSNPDYGYFNVHTYMGNAGTNGIGVFCDYADFTRSAPIPPTASITGPTSITLGSSGTYTLSGAGTNLNRLDAYFSTESPINNWANSPQLSPVSIACGGASTCGGTVVFTPSAVGTYYVVLNNTDNLGGTCTGNPWTITPPVTDCGANDAILVTVNPAPFNDAQFISQNLNLTMTPGSTQNVSVTMRNTGNRTWTVAGNYKLGDPLDNGSPWLPDIRDWVSVSVPPDTNHTFDFTITAPATPGTYNFRWMMVEEGIEWFGESTPNSAIVVNYGPPTIANATVTVSNSNYCGSGVHATVSSTYSDALSLAGDVYEVIVDNDLAADPNSNLAGMNPEFESGSIATAIPNNSTFFHNVSGCPVNDATNLTINTTDTRPQLECQLVWNTTYRAWVRARNTGGVWSPWVQMSTYCNGSSCSPPNPWPNGIANSWRTPVHRFPQTGFTSVPANPAVGLPVQFTDTTSFSGSSSGQAWVWAFAGGTPATANGQIPPAVTYSTLGTWTASLTATDDAGSCTLNQDINVQRAVPIWREVAPR